MEGKVGAESSPLLSGGRRVVCSTLSLLHAFLHSFLHLSAAHVYYDDNSAAEAAAEAASADKGEEEESYALLFQTVWVGAPIAIVRSHAPLALLLLPSSFSISSFFPFFPWLLGGERGGERGGGGGGAHPFLPPKLSLKWLLPALPLFSPPPSSFALSQNFPQTELAGGRFEKPNRKLIRLERHIVLLINPERNMVLISIKCNDAARFAITLRIDKTKSEV